MRAINSSIKVSCMALLLPLSASAQQQPDSDFPTLARVEYVLACMKKHGDLNTYDMMYGCVCAVDHVRSQFTYDEFTEAQTYYQLRRTAGERGSLFRDPDQADSLRDKLEQVVTTAESRCIPRNAAKTN